MEGGREVFRCMRAIWDGGLREQRNPRVDKFTGVRMFFCLGQMFVTT